MLTRFTRKRGVSFKADVAFKLSGHSSVVQEATPLPFPFANRIVTFSTDGTVRVYSTRKGECLQCVCVHQSRPGLSAMEALGGDVVVSSSVFDETISTWGANAGEKLETLSTDNGHNVRCITRQNSRNFIAGTQTGDLLFYSHSDGREITETGRSIAAHGACIASLASTEKRLFTASYDKTVSVWDIATLKKLSVLRQSSSAMFCVDANDSFIVTGSYGKSIRKYSAESFSLENTYGNIHTGVICSVTLLGNDHILSSSTDQTVCLTEIISGLVLARIRLAFSPLSVRVLSDGRLLATGHGGNAVVLTPPSNVGGILQVYASSKQPLPMQKARANVLSGSVSADAACANLTDNDQESCISSLEEWKALHELVMLSNRDNAGGGSHPTAEGDRKRNWWLLTLHCLARLLVTASEVSSESNQSYSDEGKDERGLSSHTEPETPWAEWSDASDEPRTQLLVAKKVEGPLQYLLAVKRWVEDQALIRSTGQRIHALAPDLNVGRGSKDDIVKRTKEVYKECMDNSGERKDGSNFSSSRTAMNLARLYLYIVVFVSGAGGCGFLRAIECLMSHIERSSKAATLDPVLHGVLVDAVTMFSEHALFEMTKKEAQNLNTILSALKIDTAKDCYRLFMSVDASGKSPTAINGEFESEPGSPSAPGSPVTPQESLEDGADMADRAKKKGAGNAAQALRMIGRSNLSPARRLAELEIAGVNALTISTMSREILSSALAAFVLSYDQRLAHKFAPLERCIFEVFVENDITSEVLSDDYVVPEDDFCQAVVQGVSEDPDCDATIGFKVRLRQFYARAVLGAG